MQQTVNSCPFPFPITEPGGDGVIYRDSQGGWHLLQPPLLHQY